MSDGSSGVSPAELLVSMHTTDNGAGWLTVAGEVDVSSVDRLTDALAVVLDREPPAVIVDLSAVRFFASAGISALIGAYHRATAAGIEFSVMNCSPIVRRVLDVTGVLKVLSRD